MNPYWKEKWLAALRSGQYKQGYGALNRDGRFCCLGVLCSLVQQEGHGRWVTTEGETSLRFSYGNEDPRKGTLPAKIIKFVDMEGSPWELISRNDGRRHTFTQIADYIEKEF